MSADPVTQHKTCMYTQPFVAANPIICTGIHNIQLATSVSLNGLIPKQSTDYKAIKCALHPVLLFSFCVTFYNPHKFLKTQ